MKQATSAVHRRLTRCAAAFAMLLYSALAFSQGFPARPIRIIVPFGPTGLPDVLTRVVAAKMSESVGQQVIVENKPGAGGIIAAQYTAQQQPDGYTIMLAGTDYAITPALHSKLPYDPIRDFAPLTQAIRGYLFIVVNTSLGVKSVPELVALAKARPGEIYYGSVGNGSLHHLGMEQFKLSAKIDLKHVPYKGVNQATPALTTGEIPVMFTTLPSIMPALKAGRLAILAVASPQRSATVPEVPTVAELGYPDVRVESTMGFVAPAATPPAIVERLNAELIKALTAPETRARLKALDVEVVTSTPEQFGERIRRDQEQFARLVREIKLKMD
ncbi:MAG: Tripartite tricarboxylate transporter family receptor [Noviherbaspirillum sp.]|jgi:tripartite-type tricarboxylate transporter receptor subunit TctC|nr:Tripartite tricarboxylate transporter family receptor [Noviherbaspirillum sp.]